MPQAKDKVFSLVDLLRHCKEKKMMSIQKQIILMEGLGFENNRYLKGLVDFLKKHIEPR
jgi:hypothetical protein